MIFDRRFERSMRRQARRELRADRTLWKEYKRNRHQWRLQSSAEGNRWGVGFFAVMMFLAVVRRADKGILSMAVPLVLFVTGAALYRNVTFLADLFHGTDRKITFTLPLSDRDYLRIRLRRFLFGCLFVVAAFAVIYTSAAVYSGQFPQAWIVILLASLLQAALAFTLLLLAVKYVPGLLRFWFFFAAFLAGVGALVVSRTSPTFTAISALSLFSPFSWASAAVLSYLGVLPQGFSLLLLPPIALVLAIPYLYPKVLDTLSNNLSQQTIDNPMVVIGDQESGTAESEFIEPPFESETPEAAEPQESSHEGFAQGSAFLEARAQLESSFESDQSWLARVIERSFQSDERVVAEFLLAGDLGNVFKTWRAGAIGALLASLLCFVPRMPGIVPWIVLLVSMSIAAPVFAGTWPALQGTILGAVGIPVYAAYPISYRQLSSVILKVTLIRLAAWCPFLLVFLTAFGFSLKLPVPYAFLGLVAIVILLFAQPAVAALRISATTNDTQQGRWQFLLFVVLMLAAGFPTVFFLLRSLIFPIDYRIALVSLVAFSVLCTLGDRLYARLYEKGRFDLLLLRTQ